MFLRVIPSIARLHRTQRRPAASSIDNIDLHALRLRYTLVSLLFIIFSCFIRISTVLCIVYLFFYCIAELHVSSRRERWQSHSSVDHSAIALILSSVYRFPCSAYIPEYPFVLDVYLHRCNRLHRITRVQLVEHIDRCILASILSHFVRY